MARYRIKSAMEWFDEDNVERRVYHIVGTWYWDFSIKPIIRAKRRLIQIDKERRNRS